MSGPNVICRNVVWTTLILGVCMACPKAAAASGFSGVGVLTSQYIFRGRAWSDGDPAIQFGLDYEHDSGVFAGMWGSTIDLQTRFGGRDTELDYYAGYHHAFQVPISLSATLVRYTFPGQTGSHSYDYNEVLISATLYENYFVTFGFTDDRNNLDRIGRHWELRSEWPIENTWVLSAGLGSNDLGNSGISRYLHWDLGASARFSRLTVDLRWYDNENPGGSLGALSADSQFVISLSAAF